MDRRLIDTVSNIAKCVVRCCKSWHYTRLRPRRGATEDAKVLVYRSRRSVVLRSAWHLIPLTACLVLLVLNIKGYFIGDVTNVLLTALQFAAKLQEILIQASFAAMLLAFIRHRLLGSNKLAYGSLVAPFEARDLAHLWSSELWGSLTAVDIDLGHRVVVGAVTLSTIILAAVVGPSSAVLLIPRPIDYPYARWTAFFDNSAMLYPRVLTNDSYLFNATAVDQLMARWTVDLHKAPWLLIDDAYTMRRQSMSMYHENGDSAYTNTVTVPTRITAHALKYLAVTGESNTVATIQAHQPIIYQECQVQTYSLDDRGDDNVYVNFGSGYEELNRWLSLTDVWHNKSAHGWMSNFSYYFQDVPADVSGDHSIVWLAASPQDDEWSPPYVEACVIHAYWTPATANLSSQSTIVGYVLDDSPTRRRPMYDLVQIKSAWANELLSSFLHHGDADDVGADFVPTILALGMSDALQDFQDFAAPYFLGGSVATSPPFPSPEGDYSTDRGPTLSQYMENNGLQSGNFFFATTTNWTELDNLDDLTTQDVRILSAGYGYDSAGVAVRLSMTVLLLYSLVTIAYLICVLTVGRASDSWNSVGDLVTLALNSHYPEHLGKTSAGVDRWSTFGEPVNIRVNDHGGLELVFANDPASKVASYYQIQNGKAY